MEAESIGPAQFAAMCCNNTLAYFDQAFSGNAWPFTHETEASALFK